MSDPGKAADADTSPNLGRDLLLKVGRRTLGTMGSLFAFSAVGVLLFPITPWAMFVGVAAILILLACVFWRASRKVVVIVLTALCMIVVTTNFAYVGAFTGPAYLFPCATLSLSCGLTATPTMYGKRILIVPVWDGPKLKLWKALLAPRASTYAPDVVTDGDHKYFQAPLEQQAVAANAPFGPGQFTVLEFFFKAPVLDLSLSLGPGQHHGAAGIGFRPWETHMFGLQSRLSPKVPGLFATQSPESSGPEDWRRAAFSNETLRALLRLPATEVLDGLYDEAQRTGLADDYMRYAVFSLHSDPVFYAGATAVTQRLFNIEEVMSSSDSRGGFALSPDHPWNQPFILAVLSDLEDLGRVAGAKTIDAPNRKSGEFKPYSEVISLSQPRVSAWLERNAPQLLEELRRGAEAMSATNADLQRVRTAAEFVALADGDDNGLNTTIQLEARRIVGLAPDAYRPALAHWMANAHGDQAYRVTALLDELDRRNLHLMFGLMDRVAKPKGRPGARVRDRDIQTAMGELSDHTEVNDGKAALAKSYAANEFQRLQFAPRPHPRTATPAMSCFADPSNCELGWASFGDPAMGGSSDVTSLKALSLYERVGPAAGADAVEQLAKRLEEVAPRRTLAEADQALAPAVLMLMVFDRPSLRRQIGPFCASAEGFSKNLLGQPGSWRRLELHEAAIVAADLCGGAWGAAHRQTMALANQQEGQWVTLLRDANRRSLAGRRLSR